MVDNMNDTSSEIELLKCQFLDADWGQSEQIGDRLMDLVGESSVDFFIQCLSVEKAKMRNRAALCLRDLVNHKSVKPLIEAVLNPIDPKNCGTLVYALEKHDCSEYLLDIFKIMFYGNYECKLLAHNILTQQSFSFDDHDLIELKKLWQECKDDPSKCPAFDELNEAIEDDVNSFLDYISEDN